MNTTLRDYHMMKFGKAKSRTRGTVAKIMTIEEKFLAHYSNLADTMTNNVLSTAKGTGMEDFRLSFLKPGFDKVLVADLNYDEAESLDVNLEIMREVISENLGVDDIRVLDYIFL